MGLGLFQKKTCIFFFQTKKSLRISFGVLQTNPPHEIFENFHGFANPPVNPKFIIDYSYCEAAQNADLNPADTVRELGGPGSRIHLTRCMMNAIIRAAGLVAIPGDVHVDRCLHSDKQPQEDPVGCMIVSQLSVENPLLYILATADNTQVANQVHGLPLAVLRDDGHAVYRPPSQRQLAYAAENAAGVIQLARQNDHKVLDHRVDRFKRKARRG